MIYENLMFKYEMYLGILGNKFDVFLMLSIIISNEYVYENINE